jgi:uncharacterized membrane-anchored protein YhcB (DUF1043 family)
MNETAIELGLLGENVKKLQEDMRSVKLAIDLQGQTLASQFGMTSAILQTGLQQTAMVVGQHLAVQDRRLENLTNGLKEHIEKTAQTLARIEAKLASSLTPKRWKPPSAAR